MTLVLTEAAVQPRRFLFQPHGLLKKRTGLRLGCMHCSHLCGPRVRADDQHPLPDEPFTMFRFCLLLVVVHGALPVLPHTRFQWEGPGRSATTGRCCEARLSRLAQLGAGSSASGLPWSPAARNASASTQLTVDCSKVSVFLPRYISPVNSSP
jgi:hypothetical protein